ncbi:hypothetical protein L6164_002361 [Bauhinia variegata]|uniref:Uncharacterized protein n=1 Tax=Bauhinia variegata TaxID=167791 RepID=A0ACB9PY04_BAUVA|nr:hypothetical protein L6164_002361 [Bauhinia variegata]
MIKINVSHAVHYELFIAAQSTFGDVKKLLVKKTGLDPEQQRLSFNGREKEDEEHLHTEGVSDKTRLLLLEGQARKEKKLEESRECDEMLNASKAVAGVRSEVDKLSEMVVTLEVAVDGGTKVSEEEFQGLTNLLMRQITKLDTIEAQGEAKLQRKAEVLRLQNFADKLESLKAKNNGNAVKEEKLPLQKTSLEPEEQGRFSRGKEKENEEHLQMEDVNKKMKLEESRARIEMMKASEAVAAVRSEVAALEVSVDCGTEVSEKEFQILIELLMKQLLKLDTIEAHGEAKLQRKAEVLRVQKFVDTVDSLTARKSDPFSNGVKVSLQRPSEQPEVRDMYGQQHNFARIFKLQRDIVNLQQSRKPFVQLLGSLKKMWNELEVYRPHTVDAAILHKGVEEDKIFQLLASLGSDYEDLRSHIIMSPEHPSLSSVCSTIQREEVRRKVMNVDHKSPLFDSRAYATNHKPKKEISYKGKRPDLKCEHCHRLGHLIERCWVLHPELKPKFAQDKGPSKHRANVTKTLQGDMITFFISISESLFLSATRQFFAFGKVGVRRRTAVLPPSSHRRRRTTRSEWDIIRGGVMVQKRNLGVEDDRDGSGSSLGGSMIKINVSHALHYEVIIAVQSTFGDVKKLLMKKTGLDPEQQRLFFNGKEKEDEEHLHTEGVSDKTRLLLLEGQARKEKKLEESRECDEMLNASKAVAGVRSEVNKLSEMVVALKVAVDGGTKVSEEEFQGLTNLLMRQIMKLDTIEAQGEAKLQRKAEVLRVQNFVDTLESLKARNNGNALKEEKLPLQKTSLEHEEQGRFSRGKEKENKEHLQMEDVNKKMKLEESRARIEMMKASEAVAAVRSEVDELSEMVAALEVAVDCGTEVSEKEFQMLNELLMKQLLKLDTIEAHGEAKLQRKDEVLRVQKFVDTVDSLKARNSDPFSNGVKAGMEYSTGDEELHEEDPIAEKTSIDSYVSARSSSQQGEAHTEELLPDGSFPETELEKLVLGDIFPVEDALLLSRFFSIHPSMLLTNPDHSDQFISFGYSSLVRLLRFLEHHTPASMDDSRRLQFLKMLRDLGSLGFNGEWLAQTKEMVLGSLLSFQDIDTQLQGLVSSEEVLMKKLKFLESKRSYLSFSLDRLIKEVKEVECSLTDVRQKVSEAQEVRRKEDVHFGF